jgi:hypothetical protein
VALRVDLGDRIDTIVSSVDARAQVTVAGGLSVRGAFSHVRQGGPREWAMLVDGDFLRNPEVTISGPVSHEGIVTGTTSIAQYGAKGAFGVSGPIPALSALVGAPLIVDQGGVLSWAYRIDAAGPGNSGSTVLSSDEPGFEISGDLIKQTSFPNWGIRGVARYRIPGYAVMSRSQGGDWSLVQTGAAVGTSSGQ